MTRRDPGADANRLAGESLAAGDATGWFEMLYAASARGSATIPWDRGSPHPLLVQWAEQHALAGDGRRALVVGCGLGDDAEFLSSRGFDAAAFDVAPSAIQAAQRRYAATRVHYSVADVLALPAAWRLAYDFVLESQTVQALPLGLRSRATEGIVACVAPGGTLLVLAAARADDDELPDVPPWPLSRAEIEAFAAHGVRAVAIEKLPNPAAPGEGRWCAEFRR